MPYFAYWIRKNKEISKAGPENKFIHVIYISVIESSINFSIFIVLGGLS